MTTKPKQPRDTTRKKTQNYQTKWPQWTAHCDTNIKSVAKICSHFQNLLTTYQTDITVRQMKMT